MPIQRLAEIRKPNSAAGIVIKNKLEPQIQLEPRQYEVEEDNALVAQNNRVTFRVNQATFRIGLLAVGLLAGAGTGLVAGAGAGLAETGPFTKQQADDGHVLFNNNCAQCHRPDLSGAMGPPLTGDQFKAKWGNKSVDELRTYIHENMPKTAPHTLSDDKLDPIVAWILTKNGDQGGDKPLNKDTAKDAKVPAKK